MRYLGILLCIGKYTLKSTLNACFSIPGIFFEHDNERYDVALSEKFLLFFITSPKKKFYVRIFLNKKRKMLSVISKWTNRCKSYILEKKTGFWIADSKWLKHLDEFYRFKREIIWIKKTFYLECFCGKMFFFSIEFKKSFF